MTNGRNNLFVSRSRRLLAAMAMFVPMALLAEVQNEVSRNIQSPPGPAGYRSPGSNLPGADPYQLLMNSPETRRDLNLTETQITHLSRVGATMFHTAMLDSSYRSERAVQEQVDSGQKAIARVLTPEQLGRLRQIMLQVEGPCGLLSDPQDLERLGISQGSTQLRRIEGICRDADRQLHQLAENANQAHRNDPCAAMAIVSEQSQGIRSRAEGQIRGVLHASQTKTLQDMKGQPLRLPPMIPPGCNDPS